MVNSVPRRGRSLSRLRDANLATTLSLNLGTVWLGSALFGLLATARRAYLAVHQTEVRHAARHPGGNHQDEGNEYGRGARNHELAGT